MQKEKEKHKIKHHNTNYKLSEKTIYLRLDCQKDSYSGVKRQPYAQAFSWESSVKFRRRLGISLSLSFVTLQLFGLTGRLVSDSFNTQSTAKGIISNITQRAKHQSPYYVMNARIFNPLQSALGLLRDGTPYK